MNNFTKKLLIDEINSTVSGLGRKSSQQISHYLDVIFKVLKTGSQWHTINSILHYTTYHKKFLYWNKLNVFQNTYIKLLKLIKSKFLNYEFTKQLFIDSSMIKNIRGIDCLGSNIEKPLS